MELFVPKSATGVRLDQYLAAQGELSRSQIGVRINAGDVLVDGKVPNKAGLKLRGGEHISMHVPPPPPSEALPEEISIDVLYEDEHLIVVNKQAGMVVHPSPGHETGTLVNALLFRFDTLAPGINTEDGRPRPGIVHRLDLNTTGAMVVARSVTARDALSRQLAERTMSRRYLAVVHGRKLDDEGTFDTFHDRHPKDRKRFSTRVSTGRRAVTHWKVLARCTNAALVECKLETGRTHQIRVHFSDAGHPIIGDTTYGGLRRVSGVEGSAIRKLQRQALHAFKLTFIHPITQVPVSVRAPLPADMEQLVSRLFVGFEMDGLS